MWERFLQLGYLNMFYFFGVVEGGGKDNVHVNCRSSEDRTLEVRLQSKNPCLAEFTRAAAGMTELCCLMPRFYCV